MTSEILFPAREGKNIYEKKDEFEFLKELLRAEEEYRKQHKLVILLIRERLKQLQKKHG